MKERPILFSAPMVRALLAGTKTQTRRAVSWANSTRNGGKDNVYDLERAWADHGFPSPDGSYRNHYLHVPYWHQADGDHGASDRVRCRWDAGDRLLVREQFSYEHGCDKRDRGCPIWYWADGQPDYGDWTRPKPSIHMPRWASRITLEVTGVRVERLQEISGDDAIEEGIDPSDLGDAREEAAANVGRYCELWEQINGPGSWDADPWVWCVSFRRLTP